jgi:Tol biopolymer transport system component
LYFHRFDRNGDSVLSQDEYPFRIKYPNVIQFLSADGAELRQIYVNLEFPLNGSPAVSPDGQMILFDTWRRGESYSDSRIFLMNIDGSDVRDLCHGLMPTWSADGKQFTCSRYEPGTNGVWIMNRDGTEASRIGDGWGSQWSPDGQTIAFTRNGGIAAFDVPSREIRT